MTRLWLAMIIGGVVLGVWAWNENRLSGKAAATPQTISCAELCANGPGANANVVMTDFVLCAQGFVYEADSKRKDYWTKIYVPAVPLGGEYHKKVVKLLEENKDKDIDLPPPEHINVIVKTDKVHRDEDLDALIDADTLSGLVVNEIQKLDGEEKRLLQQSYPGTDFSNVWILEHERKPKGASLLALLWTGSAVLIILPVGHWLWSRRQASMA